MRKAFAVFPNQIFKEPPPRRFDIIVLIEARRFFSDFNFHKKKLILHRASLQYYKALLKKKGYNVLYLNHAAISKSKNLSVLLKKQKITSITLYDPADEILQTRLENDFKSAQLRYDFLDSPLFICDSDYLHCFFQNKSHLSMNSFYIEQRKRLNILIENQKPIGHQWSFDKQNREKLNKGITIPTLYKIKMNAYIKEATEYIKTNFPDNPGQTDNFVFPVTHSNAENCLNDFLKNRLDLFGPYEDAISTNECFLFHSLLSAPINTGLLKPLDVANSAIKFAQKNNIRLNSLEGFIRQIIGWREFIHTAYILKSKQQRNSNFWNFNNKIPKSFYTATTGIPPIDLMIKRVLQSAYLHHIERLMVVGNFMLLCEIHPKEVYRWFMEMFIDAYDWVMLPNVFGMSQYADGGSITTKPYISSSNYILKMSDFKKANWCDIWDSLFWNFILKHKKVFAANPRMKVMAIQADRMTQAKRKHHIKQAEIFLTQLHST